MLCVNFGWNWPSSSEERIFKYFQYHFTISLLSPLRKGFGAFIWTNLNPLYIRMICAKFGWNLTSGSGEYFFNIFNRILHFCYYLPLEKGVALHLNKLESSQPKDDLCQVWLKYAQCFWRRKCFNIFNRIFNRIIAIISPWNWAWPFI